MRYKNYIFDLYGTLVDINTDEWSAQLWKKMAILYGYYGAAYTFKELGKAYRARASSRKRRRCWRCARCFAASPPNISSSMTA